MSIKKASYPPINIGTSFLLSIFIILCMVIFAVLSLANAIKDYEYSTQTANRTTEYYQACNQAEEFLYQATKDDCNQDVIEYQVPINESQVLKVVLKHDIGSESSYKVLSWTQETVSHWTGTQKLPVMGSE